MRPGTPKKKIAGGEKGIEISAKDVSINHSKRENGGQRNLKKESNLKRDKKKPGGHPCKVCGFEIDPSTV